MPRKRPFFRPQIDSEIEEKLKNLKAREHYHGSMASYVEGILDRYAEGLLTQQRNVDHAEFAGFEEKDVKRHKRAS